MPTLFTAVRAHRKPRKRRAVAQPPIPGGAPLPGAPGYTPEAGPRRLVAIDR